MKIRIIEPQDIEVCASIFVSTFSKNPWNEAWTLDAALERLWHFYNSKGFYGLIATETQALGFVLGNVEPYYTGSLFCLREMCVAATSQSKGIGTQLLKTLEEELTLIHVRRIYLLTSHDTPASRFYQKAGYERNETFGIYVRDY